MHGICSGRAGSMEKRQGARGKEKRHLAGSTICAIYIFNWVSGSLRRCVKFIIRCVFASLREIYFNCVSAALRDKCFNASLREI